jgi:patatin-related protein
MYGGVSLAIYINGVAQELLRLVRATAPEVDAEGRLTGVAFKSDQELSGTERVYRKLGRMLSRDLKEGFDPNVDEQTPIRTRFVVDILTGTSAGGINAVYLAKALANDQSMDDLMNLWRTEGDIKKLLNDRESTADSRLDPQEPPRSLLNSRRMYWKLLEAMRRMDEARPSAERPSEKISPYAEEIDLYVTATDMPGRALSLKLADDVTFEYRHRNVFHFRYRTRRASGEDRNDFNWRNNPFLAFAARCTSAHPAAFEAMRFADIDEVLNSYPRNGEHERKAKELRQYYREYLQPRKKSDTSDSLAEDFARRPFNDGGVLDNSPFSYALEELPSRHAEVPVDRKLIYLEPSPEHPELENREMRQLDFLQNAWDSLSTLPRYQTIVEDLTRLRERNLLIERVNRILAGHERDVFEMPTRYRSRSYQRAQAAEPSTDEEMRLMTMSAMKRMRDALAGKSLGELIRSRGTSWGGYHRLRVAEVTDELTLLVARAAGFDDESDEFLAVREIVRYWRDHCYDAYPESAEKDPVTGEQKASEMAYLLDYDLNWTLRRIKFVVNKIDQLTMPGFYASTGPLAQRTVQFVKQAVPDFDWDFLTDDTGSQSSFESNREFCKALREIKSDLSLVLRGLRMARRNFRAARVDQPDGDEMPNPFQAEVDRLGISASDLRRLLRMTDEERGDWLKQLWDEKKVELHALTDKVREEIQRAVVNAVNLSYQHLDPQPVGEALTPYQRAGRQILRYYFQRFSAYDQISYPILYSSGVGDETDLVEVFRISPEDSTAIFKESVRRDKENAALSEEERARRQGENEIIVEHKLAGTTLANFGAFFEERFRINDIKWGRLDGAERLITALLPKDSQKEIRKQLIREAQLAIIVEDHREEDSATLAAELMKEMKSPDLGLPLRDTLAALLQKVDPLEKFKSEFARDYEENRKFDPEDTLRSAARASRIFGRMLDGYAEAHHKDTKAVKWIARLTRWFWGLVEVAVPDSIGNRIAHYWLQLLYLFEALLLAGSYLLVSKEMQHFALIALGATAMAHVLLRLASDYMTLEASAQLKRLVRRSLLTLLLLAILVIAGYYLLPMTLVLGRSALMKIVFASLVLLVLLYFSFPHLLSRILPRLIARLQRLLERVERKTRAGRNRNQEE